MVGFAMGVEAAPPVSPARVRALKARYGIREGPVLLSVSRLVPMKGHAIVIDALVELLPRFPELVYLVVGQGPERPALETRARARGVGSRVRFAGAVPADDLAAHYALATLFVQLSRETGEYDGLEGFGLSFLEAASFGVASIAGRSGGVPEAIAEGESGLLDPPENAAALPAAAARLLADPRELRRLAEGARHWAASHPWEASVRCLRTLTNGAPTSRAPIPRRVA